LYVSLAIDPDHPDTATGTAKGRLDVSGR